MNDPNAAWDDSWGASELSAEINETLDAARRALDADDPECAEVAEWMSAYMDEIIAALQTLKERAENAERERNELLDFLAERESKHAAQCR